MNELITACAFLTSTVVRPLPALVDDLNIRATRNTLRRAKSRQASNLRASAFSGSTANAQQFSQADLHQAAFNPTTLSDAAPLEYILPLHQRHLRLQLLESGTGSPVRLTSQSLRVCGICFSPLPIDAFVPALQRQTVWRESLTCCTWPQPVSKRTLSVVSASSRAACAILIIIFLRLPECSACSRLTTRRPLRSLPVRVLP